MTPLTPELKAYLDEWRAEIKLMRDEVREWRTICHETSLMVAPAVPISTSAVVPAPCVTAPVASSDTADLALASAGLAEPSAPVPAIGDPPAVVPAVPIDTIAVVPAPCSTDRPDEDADEHGASFASSSLSSSTTQFTAWEDGSPTAPTSCAAPTPTMSSAGDQNRVVTKQWSAPAPATALTAVVDLIPVHAAAVASAGNLDGKATCGVELTPATCSTGGLLHDIGRDIPELMSMTPWASTTEVGVLPATSVCIPWASTRPWMEPVPPRPPDPRSLFPGAWFCSRPEACITGHSAVNTVLLCNNTVEVPTYEASQHDAVHRQPWPPPSEFCENSIRGELMEIFDNAASFGVQHSNSGGSMGTTLATLESQMLQSLNNLASPVTCFMANVQQRARAKLCFDALLLRVQECSSSCPEASIKIQSTVKTVQSCNGAKEVWPYVLFDEVLHNDEIQWPPWPPPWYMGNIRKGHMFSSRIFSSFECNQEEIPSTTCLVQSCLGPSARPKLCSHFPSSNHMVSVTLLAHPSENPLRQLLSPTYKQVSDSAAGQVDHTLLQSHGDEICQLLTQRGEYLNLCLKLKPPWLSILTKIDTEVAKGGVHPQGEEIEYVQLIMKLQLRRPYSELTIKICIHELHLTTRGREAGLHSIYKSTSRPLLPAPGIPHSNKKMELSGVVRELTILQNQGYGWIYHGFILICCLHATLLPAQNADEDVIVTGKHSSVPMPHTKVLLDPNDYTWCCWFSRGSNQATFQGGSMPALGRQKELESPWDPGGAPTTCKQGTFDAMTATAVFWQVFTAHKFYLVVNEVHASVSYHLGTFFHWDSIKHDDSLYLYMGYFCDPDQVKAHRLQWDLGSFSMVSAWGQAEFQGGGDVRNLSC